jgi:hypothetical protein
VPGRADKPPLKKRLILEGRRAGLLFGYLVLLLGCFTTYKRIILGEHGIAYFHYGYAFLEAAVLTKVILLGKSLRIGERFSHKPLIIPTLHKTVAFGILTFLFGFLEHLAAGLLHGNGLVATAKQVLANEKVEILAQMVVLLVAFIPLFVVWELGRVVGEEKVFRLFFRRNGQSEDQTAAL